MKKIPHLNEQNEIIGEVTFEEAMEKGYMRRIARVFLFDTNKNLLLQRRSSDMRTFPDLWDQSAGGHVDAGESDLAAAERELFEELGVKTSLTEIVTGHKSNNPNDRVFSSVYVGMVSKDVDIIFDVEEVSSIKWFSINEFEETVGSNPEEFVPTFVSIWRDYRDKIIPS